VKVRAKEPIQKACEEARVFSTSLFNDFFSPSTARMKED
jgi:hypothetical protein